MTTIPSNPRRRCSSTVRGTNPRLSHPPLTPFSPRVERRYHRVFYNTRDETYQRGMAHEVFQVMSHRGDGGPTRRILWVGFPPTSIIGTYIGRFVARKERIWCPDFSRSSTYFPDPRSLCPTDSTFDSRWIDRFTFNSSNCLSRRE